MRRTALAEVVELPVIIYRTTFSCKSGEYVSTLEEIKIGGSLEAGLLPSNPLGRSKSNGSPVIESHCGYAPLPSRLSAIMENKCKVGDCK